MDSQLPPGAGVPSETGVSQDVTTTPPGTPATKARPAKKRAVRARRKRGWKFFALVGFSGPLIVLSAVMGYYYVLFSRMIDARIHGEMQRVDPRVFARPFELHRGQSLTAHQLVDRLNDLGYANRPKAALGGEFAIGRDALVIVPKDGNLKEQQVRVVFGGKRPKDADPAVIERIEVVGTKATTADLTLGAPLITALVPTGREKRRDVPLAAIPAEHDQRRPRDRGPPLLRASRDRSRSRSARAVFSNVFHKSEYTRGGSTLTQQLVKNTFLTQEKSLRRKMTEWFMSVVLERRLSKPQILELYLNDVWLGQRGSFAIHGVGEAARLFFGKDISNLSLTEAATIAGMIQSPPRLSPFNNPDRSRERRNVVLHAMADSGFITAADADRACRGAAPGRGARARGRSAVFRRLRQPGDPGSLQAIRGFGRRLHDARPAPAAGRTGCRPRRAHARG